MNVVNAATQIMEMIELPSTDINVAVLRWLRSQLAFQDDQWWLGAQFGAEKIQLRRDPNILGVEFGFKEMPLLIKQPRKEETLDEIESILKSKLAPPSQGKHMLGAVQLWSKVDRALLRSLSGRQCMKFPVNEINKGVKISLEPWSNLVLTGPLSEIEFLKPKRADYVILTNGSFHDGTPGAPLKPWIGGVIFAKEPWSVSVSQGSRGSLRLRCSQS